MTTEIEEALDIARKTRREILFGKNSLEKNILGLYTAAQILGRDDDMQWAKSELNGYDGNYPSYRTYVSRLFTDKYHHQVDALIGGNVSHIPCGLSIPEITKSLDPKSPKHPSIVLADSDIDNMDDNQKKTIKGIPGITWRFHNNSLVQILSDANVELARRTNNIIAEITYGEIPEGIFKKFQGKVNALLTDSNPAAVSELNTAYENLVRFGDPEKAAHVAFSCRRLIRAVADELFPAQNKPYTKNDGNEIKVGKDHFLNRLKAYVDSSRPDNREYLVKKIDLLEDMYRKIPESINKGIHANITNEDAEMLVIYSYMILGEILLEAKKQQTPGRQKRARRSNTRKPDDGARST